MKLETKDKKHIAAVGGILCAIGGIAALCITLANMVSAPIIAKNEAEAIQNALGNIYDGKYYDDEATPVKGHDYIEQYWVVYKDEAKTDSFGYVFQGSGTNSYGDITLCVGIDNEGTVGKFETTKNTESFRSKLIAKYIDPYNADPSTANLDNVKCGATYGAKLIKSIVEDAQSVFEEVK